jgi:hypothetical protein
MTPEMKGLAYTKLLAVREWMRGNRGVARILWRWMDNLPTPKDIEAARKHIRSRPDVQAEIARLNATPPGPPAPPDTSHLPRPWA